MINFGTTKLTNEVSLLLIRKKVSSFAGVIGFDSTKSVRMAIVVAEFGRYLLEHNLDVLLEFKCDINNKPGIYIYFKVNNIKDVYLKNYLGFFDESSYNINESGLHIYTVYKKFKGRIPHFTREFIKNEKEKLENKSREELVEEVIIKNFELKEMNHSLLKFVPKDFLYELGKTNITEFELGDATEKDFTILFSDMRSFSTLAEGMTPSELIAFINSYLSTVVPLIHKFNGFVITYLGDAIMAAFPGKPSDALRSALGMMNALTELNKKRFEERLQEIRIGIGINSGSAMIGIIGEQGRMEPTIMSDVVNLAARLESLTKQYGISIVFSNSTFDRLTEEEKGEFFFRALDEVRVIGKKISVSLYELYAKDWNDYTDLKIKYADEFEYAYQLYRKKEIVKAYQLYKYLYSRNPLDKSCLVIMQRIEKFIAIDENGNITQKQLPADWDHIHNLDSK